MDLHNPYRFKKNL